MKTSDTPENGDSFEDEDAALFKNFADAVNDEDIEAQEEAMLQVWQHIAEKQDEEPSSWLKAMQEAHQCEAAFDWMGAEESYKRAIDAEKDKPMLVARAQGQLASLYGLVGLEALALQAMQAATQATREADMAFMTSLQLQGEARFYLKAKESTRAWVFINEAFDLLEDGPMHHLERAYALVLRAECYSQQEETKKAEADLEYAWKLLEPHAGTFFAAGWQNGLSQWWAAKAQLHLRAQPPEWSESVACWREVVERRRIISGLPQLEGPYKYNGLAKSLNELGKALHQIGDDSAAECFAESRSIRHSIGLAPFEN
ncbi:hypothetical protein IAD21_04558 [Abditibacteriota bacterium]|nr:hypothetical protein IAD21_04558 [Abditibacteriota bacterium]